MRSAAGCAESGSRCSAAETESGSSSANSAVFVAEAELRAEGCCIVGAEPAVGYEHCGMSCLPRPHLTEHSGTSSASYRTCSWNSAIVLRHCAVRMYWKIGCSRRVANYYFDYGSARQTMALCCRQSSLHLRSTNLSCHSGCSSLPCSLRVSGCSLNHSERSTQPQRESYYYSMAAQSIRIAVCRSSGSWRKYVRSMSAGSHRQSGRRNPGMCSPWVGSPDYRPGRSSFRIGCSAT